MIFTHIPKTGGTTVRFLARTRLGSNVWIKDLDGLVHDGTFVMGHHPYGIHTRWPERPYVYLTILRDPVERLWSHYHSVLICPEHYLHARARALGPVRYVQDRVLGHENDNTQTRMISGVGYSVGMYSDFWDHPEMYRNVTAADLDTAQRNLRQYRVVGLYEQFPETVRRIYAALGWGAPDLSRRDNWGLNKPKVIPDRVRQAFEEATVFDQQLYALAQTLFEEQGIE